MFVTMRSMHTDREKACRTAAKACLPVNGVVVVMAVSQHVYGCYDDQVDTHAKVSKGQVAHEETRNSQFGATA